MKIVLSRKGPFKMTIYLMQQYFEEAFISNNYELPCWERTDRPDLILDYKFPVHPELDFLWNGIDEDVIYDLAACELIRFKDCLSSRLDKDLITAVEKSIKNNHELEVIIIPEAVLARAWEVIFSPEQNRELVEIKI